MVPPPPASSSTLATANQVSTDEWRRDLGRLFEHAKERFADVVWELGDDPDQNEEVWGHKAIVYARAPPSFQARYFKFRPAPSATPSPYGSSPIPNSQSAYSLSLPMDDLPTTSRSPSPFTTRRAMSPAPSSIAGQILRLNTNIAPVLFTNELEYLYTGKGLSDAFEFLFDSSPEKPLRNIDSEDDEAGRIDKLRNDLIYMWRSRLYSDVRLTLTGNFPSGYDSDAVEELSTAVFSSHKFILVSRSNYFRDRLQSSGFATISDDENEVKLPSPPFTPASVHFTLGYIYTGTLSFSHRSFNLATAFHIFRSATYLQLDTLYKEIEARVVEEMMHGLFHAFLPFDQYEKITAGRWGVGGCKCKQCQRRAPRILEFAMAGDVNNPILTRGAQRALSGMFGEGWCFSEFAALPPKTRSNLVKGVSLRATSINVIPLLFAAQAAMYKLENNHDGWAEEVREMILTVRKRIDDTMCNNCEEVFEQEEWVAILERDGAVFGDTEKVGWAMDSLRRGVNERNAGFVYQTLVSAVLIRPHPTTGSTLLPSTSVIRASVERARVDILAWIGRQKRWQLVHAAGGFEELDDWALKEISHELDVPMDVLQTPVVDGAMKGPPRGFASTSGSQKLFGDNESASISSVHTSATRSRSGAKEPTPSVHSVSKASMTSTNTVARRFNGGLSNLPSTPPPAPSSTSRGAPAARLKPILSSRLGSVASQPSPQPGMAAELDDDNSSVHRTSYAQSTPPITPTSAALPLSPEAVSPRPNSMANSVSSVRSSTSAAPPLPPETVSSRPKSIANSVSSVRSSTSTIRKKTNAAAVAAAAAAAAAAGAARLAVPGAESRRPESTMSSRSGASSTFRTANSASDQPSPRRSPKSTPTSPNAAAARRTRTNSTSSNVSAVSAVSAKSGTTTGRNSRAGAATNGEKKTVPSGPRPIRPRRGSEASTATTRSTVRKQASSASRLPLPPKSDSPAAARGKPIVRTPSGSTAASTATTRNRRPPSAGVEIYAKNGDTDVPDITGIEKVVHPATPPMTDILLPPSAPPAYHSEEVSPRRNLVFPIPPADLKGKGKEPILDSNVEDLSSRPNSIALRSSIATGKSDGASTVKLSKGVDGSVSGGRRRKNSGDTITESTVTASGQNTLRPPKRPPPQIPRSRRGIMLNIGIPCIISSKRTRFRAFARYIGEVDGESGPWVGVEVPLGENWKDDKLSGRDWNDGSLNGTRYFDIGGNHAGWDDGEQRAAQRRRIDGVFSDKSSILSRKREGDQLSIDMERLKRLRSTSPAVSDGSASAEVRGLFVRPQQVLYVVNAGH
ncbi:hypothetical protein FRB95_013043 [Tulasnella sp. JGI-2019a]|nr:hypothetical protein FRB95_013043 [Tulasnella sp. JGI-2019a]